ncbi:MAG: hypothetical protein HYY03_07300, partial [Chloroflexi bacterium]|nr:hypothetical protein [Chloroflexota bacterium]
MKASAREEIFEECLSAHLEGRRTIEESLSLYPRLAAELEPLLRTAAEVADRLAYSEPASETQDSIRLRWLARARARRRLRQFAPQPRAVRSGNWRLGLAAVAASAFVVALALLGVSMLGGGGSGNQVTAPTSSPQPVVEDLPSLIAVVQQQNAKLREFKESGQPADPDVLKQVVDTAGKISSQVEDPA